MTFQGPWLVVFYLGAYTTQLYRDCNRLSQGFLLNPPVWPGMAGMTFEHCPGGIFEKPKLSSMFSYNIQLSMFKPFHVA